jgi:MFS family permease
MVITSLLTGALVQRIGYYTPIMIVGICVMSVGAGLLTTLQIKTPTANLIGYQIIYGCGLGLSSQAPNLAAQTALAKNDVPIGVSLMIFSQLLSGAIFVSVGQNVFENQLLQRLSSVSGFNPKIILNNGATSLTNLPAPLKMTVLLAYNESLRQLFQVGLILVCVNMIGALAMEWRSVKKDVIRQEKEGGEDGNRDLEGERKNIRDGSSTIEKKLQIDGERALELTDTEPPIQRR